VGCGEALEHESDHCDADKGCNGARVAFEVSSEASASTDPGQGALDDPALWQDFEVLKVGAFDDLDCPGSCPRDGGGHFRPLVAAVGVDALDEGKEPASLAQQLAGAIAILDVAGVDHDAQQEAEGVDEDVALAARDLLARIEALRVDRGPPFCAALALWLSMMATVGLASRPSASRTAT
jgi:hypothetical protein